MSFFDKNKLPGLIQLLKKKANTRFVKYGMPFLIFVVGGSFGLKYFTGLRYEYSKTVYLKPEELAKQGIEMKKPEEVTLENIYEEVKQLDIDNWTNKRGPRPWEQSEET